MVASVGAQVVSGSARGGFLDDVNHVGGVADVPGI
jgi:hypothetical protein